MITAGAVTQKIKKQLRENGMGELPVKTVLCANHVWLTFVFFYNSPFTELDVLFAFQGWNFSNVATSEGFHVGFVTPGDSLPGFFPEGVD